MRIKMYDTYGRLHTRVPEIELEQYLARGWRLVEDDKKEEDSSSSDEEQLTLDINEEND